MVEKAAYSPSAPWPANAAGTGSSLQRAALLDYANDPINWFAAAPTPGTLSLQTSQDVDGDGLPDVWEMGNGTDPYTADGNQDADGDGYSNYAEWLAGTDPQDAASYLRLTAATTGTSAVTLGFEAMAGRSYTLLGTLFLNDPAWFTVTNLTAAATNRVIQINPIVTGSQFYRVVTPAQ